MGKGSKTTKMRQKESRRKLISRKRRQVETAKQEAKQRKMG
jgi:hypothetical protein